MTLYHDTQIECENMADRIIEEVLTMKESEPTTQLDIFKLLVNRLTHAKRSKEIDVIQELVKNGDYSYLKLR